MKFKPFQVQKIKQLDAITFTDLDDTFLASENAIDRYAKSHNLTDDMLEEDASADLLSEDLVSPFGMKKVKGGMRFKDGDILPFTLMKTLHLFTTNLEKMQIVNVLSEAPLEKENLEFPFFKPIAVTARDFAEWNKAYDSGVNISNVGVIDFGALLIETNKPLEMGEGYLNHNKKTAKVKVNEEYEEIKTAHFKKMSYTRHSYYEDIYDAVKNVMANFKPDPYFQPIIQDLVGEFDFKQNFSLKIKTEKINGEDYDCYVKLNFTMPDSLSKEALKHFEYCIRNRLGEENKGKIRQDIRFVKTKRGLVLQSSVDTKEYAVEYLINAFKAINPKIITIGMGNAEVDLPFMNLTDISIKNNLFN